MINARIISPDATLNNFTELSTVKITPGENADVAIRLFDENKDIRYVTAATAQVKLRFTNKDGTTLEKTATAVDVGDRSMWRISLTQMETANLGGTNIEVELDLANDDVTVWLAAIRGGVSLVLTSGNC